jgi:hypothetical protein
MDYRKQFRSSQIHLYLNNKHDVNNWEPIHFKNLFEYKDKEIAKAFTSISTSADFKP